MLDVCPMATAGYEIHICFGKPWYECFFRSHGSHLVCGDWLLYSAVRGSQRLSKLYQISSSTGYHRDVVGWSESPLVESTVYSTSPGTACMLCYGTLCKHLVTSGELRISSSGKVGQHSPLLTYLWPSRNSVCSSQLCGLGSVILVNKNENSH